MICWRFSMSMAACNPGISNEAHMPSFVRATPMGLFSMISCAFTYAASSKTSGGKTSVTRPILSASSDSNKRPVNMISWARAAPMRRGSNQLVPISHAERPILMNAALKRAVSEQIRRSEPRTRAKPPPAAGPFTAAMIGCGIDLLRNRQGQARHRIHDHFL